MITSLPVGSGLDQSDAKYCGNPRFTKFEGFRIQSPNEATISPGLNASGPYSIGTSACSFLTVTGNQAYYSVWADRYAGYMCHPSSYGEAVLPYATPISSFESVETFALDCAKNGAHVTTAKDPTGYSVAVLDTQSAYGKGELTVYRFDNSGVFKRKQRMLDQGWITSAEADSTTDAIIFAGLDAGKPYFGNIYWSESQQMYFETTRNTNATTINFDNTDAGCILTAEILNNSLFVCLQHDGLSTKESLVAEYEYLGNSTGLPFYSSTNTLHSRALTRKGNKIYVFQASGSDRKVYLLKDGTGATGLTLLQSTTSSHILSSNEYFLGIAYDNRYQADAMPYLQHETEYMFLCCEYSTQTVLLENIAGSTAVSTIIIDDINGMIGSRPFYTCADYHKFAFVLRGFDEPFSAQEVIECCTSMYGYNRNNTTILRSTSLSSGNVLNSRYVQKPGYVSKKDILRTHGFESNFIFSSLKKAANETEDGTYSYFTVGSPQLHYLLANSDSTHNHTSSKVKLDNVSSIQGSSIPFLLKSHVVPLGLPFRPIIASDSREDATDNGVLQGNYKYCAVVQIISGSNIYEGMPSAEYAITVDATYTSEQIKLVLNDFITTAQSFDDVSNNSRIKIYRTTDNGSVYYELNGSVTTEAGELVYYDTATDTEIVQRKKLYSTGSAGYVSGVAPNWVCPSHTASWVGKSRMIVGGLEDRTIVQFSKLIVPGESISFTHPSANQWRVKFNERITAVAELGDAYLVFAESKIWAIFGQGPDDTVYGQGVFEAPSVISPAMGAVSQASVVEGANGIYFQTASGQLGLIQRGSYAVSIVSDRVKEYLGSTRGASRSIAGYDIRSAWKSPDGLIYFALGPNSGTALLIFDELKNVWVTDGIAATGLETVCGDNVLIDVVDSSTSAPIQVLTPGLIKTYGYVYAECAHKDMVRSFAPFGQVRTSYISPGGFGSDGALRQYGWLAGRFEGGFANSPYDVTDTIDGEIWAGFNREDLAKVGDVSFSAIDASSSGSQSGMIVSTMPGQQKCANFAIEMRTSSAYCSVYSAVFAIDKIKDNCMEMIAVTGRF